MLTNCIKLFVKIPLVIKRVNQAKMIREMISHRLQSKQNLSMYHHLYTLSACRYGDRHEACTDARGEPWQCYEYDNVCCKSCPELVKFQETEIGEIY